MHSDVEPKSEPNIYSDFIFECSRANSRSVNRECNLHFRLVKTIISIIVARIEYRRYGLDEIKRGPSTLANEMKLHPRGKVLSCKSSLIKDR